MAIFDYLGGDGRALIQEAYQLATYDAELSADLQAAGWREVSASELGLTPSVVDASGFFIGESALDAQAKVLVRTAADGSIEQIGITIAGTNNIADVPDYLSLLDKSYDNGFDYLFAAVRDLAVANGLTGEDVTFTGYSLGGGAVNLAAEERETRLDGFFADANYFGFASPAIAEGENVFNFGFENDVVFSVGGGTATDTPPSVLDVLDGNDESFQSSTDNIVLFNDVYANPLLNILPPSILNPTSWSAHLDGANNVEFIERISSSTFYEQMERDDVIIVSNLSDLARPITWVEDIARYTSAGHLGQPTFVLGTDKADLIGDGDSSDFLDGFAGNDTFRLGEGNDTVNGGEGADTVQISGSLGDYEVMRLSDGTVYLFDHVGDNGLEELQGVETVSVPGFLFTTTYEVTSSGLDNTGWFGGTTAYDAATEGSDNADVLTGTANRDRIFAGEGDDTVRGGSGDDLLHGGDGNDTLIGGTGADQLFGAAGDDILAGGAADDILAGGVGYDIFVFTDDFGNDVISDFDAFGQGDDVIIISPDLFDDFLDLIGAASEVGEDVLIEIGQNSLLLEHLSLADLTSNDFQFTDMLIV